MYPKRISNLPSTCQLLGDGIDSVEKEKEHLASGFFLLVADADEINSVAYFFQRATWRALFMTISHHSQFPVSFILKPNMKKAPALLLALLSFSTAIEAW
jgi:hypothetical protein